MVGFTLAWGRAILKRYNERGPGALTDGRPDNGADPKLTPTQQAELLTALQAAPPDGGLGSRPKVAAFVKDRFGAEVWPRPAGSGSRISGSGSWSHARGTRSFPRQVFLCCAGR